MIDVLILRCVATLSVAFLRLAISDNNSITDSQYRKLPIGMPENELLGYFDLPVEVVHRILHWLIADPIGFLPVIDHIYITRPVPHSYYLNHVRLGRAVYTNLLSLSSTCTFLRGVVGPYLFKSLSVIRQNQLDVTVSNPKSLEQFSDSKKYLRQFIKELLDRNFEACSKEYLAQNSFKVGVNGDSSFKSRYRKLFSINNFITYLECDNSLLTGEALLLFPHLTDLKVLDVGLSERVSLQTTQTLDCLTYLSFNSKTWSNLDNLSLRNLKRLDLLMDFNELDPNLDIKHWTRAVTKIRHLLELNIFINRANVVHYLHFVDFLSQVCRNCKTLCSINLRVLRKQNFINDSLEWECVDENPGTTYIDMFRSLPNLHHLGIEESILHQLQGVQGLISDPHDLCLTIIDPTVNSPRLNRESRRSVSSLVLALGVSSIKLAYGEVLDQSHVQALNLMTDLVRCISSDSSYQYTGLTKIAIEKCWSVSDDTIMIDYYVSDLKSPSPSTKAKFSRAAPWTRTKFNSPRYRIPETYLFEYVPIPVLKLNDQNICFEGLTSRDFWSVESSLLEFQQYSMKRKAPSSIWD